jgi:copper(I)-binding protein
MKRFLIFLHASLGLLLSFSPAYGATLEVHDAWIREAPPTSSVLAAYMVISNTGEAPVEITAIASPDLSTPNCTVRSLSQVARMAPIENFRYLPERFHWNHQVSI